MKLSLRESLVIPFAAQLLILFAIVGLLSFQTSYKSVKYVVSQLQNEMSARIIDRVEALLAIPPIVNQINKNAIESGNLNVKKDSEMEQYFYRQLHAFPSIAFNFYAGDSKRYFCAIRQNDGQVQNLRMTGRNDEDGKLLKFYTTFENGDSDRFLRSVYIGDPRNRPWYQAALNDGQATWTKIYPSNANKDLSITAVTPVSSANGEFLGVTGTAFQFRRVEQFLKTLPMSENSLVFIMEDSGNLVATSTPSPGFLVKDNKVTRLAAINSENKTIRLAGGLIKEQKENQQVKFKRDQQLQFELDGEIQLMKVSPLNLHKNINFLIVVVTPESDFLEDVNRNNRYIIGLFIVALIAAIIIANYTTNWIAKPILKLNLFAKKITQQVWEKPLNAEGSKELKELIFSFNIMALQLRSSMDALQQRIDERTMELNQTSSQMQALRKNFERSEKQLAENEALINQHIICSSTDANGVIIEVSEAFCQLTEYKQEELIGLSHGILHHPKQGESSYINIWRSVLKGESWHGEVHSLSKTGREFWIDMQITPHKDSLGNIIGFETISRDISYLKLAKENKG